MLAPFYFVKTQAPKMYRMFTYVMHPIKNFVWTTQYKRRGVLYTALVHCVLIAGILITLVGIFEGVPKAVVAGVWYTAVALGIKFLFDIIRRRRRGRHTLPSRR
jgi:tryptophan-rich sensory protein